LKLTKKKSAKNVKASVQLVPVPLIIVTLVPKKEETKSPNAHAHTDNTLMEKTLAKIVTINVKNVLDLLTTVFHVVMYKEEKHQTVNVILDGMMMEIHLVLNVYQNVTNV